MSIVDLLLRRGKLENQEKSGDPFVEAIGELQGAIELLGETWKAVTEIEDGPRHHNKINVALLAAECMKANGLHRVLAHADTFGPGIADIRSVAAKALGVEQE